MATSSDTFESWSGHPKPESVDDHKQPEIHTLLGFDVAKANDRSWRAPAFMLGSLVTGLGIAVAHHFMCWSLNGRAVADVAISQAWTSRFGTALAFLVKAAFTISIGTAYVQHQWLTLHQKSFRTDEVDALTSVLGSVFSFLTSAVWLKHPLLALIALIAWLIPLATIVAPGSLTVAPAEFSRVIDTQVPQPDFSNDTNFGLKNDMNPLKPDVRINKIAYQVATSGRSVPLVPEFSNSTYHLDFDAPAVRCAPANESIVRKRTVDFGPTTNYGRGVSVTSFASWTGPYLTDRDDHDSLDSATFFTFDLDYQSTDAARVFVMTNKGQRAWDNFLETDEPEIFWKRIVNVTECLLYNASYSVDFIFKDGVQTQDLSISKWMNPIPLDVRSWMGNTAKLKPYAAMMQAFGSLLVGKNSVQATAGVLEEDTSSARKMLDVDWDDTEALPGSLERLFHDLTLSVPSNEELL